jgi:hypothetical protein
MGERGGEETGREGGREGGERQGERGRERVSIPKTQVEGPILQGNSHFGFIVNVKARIDCQASAKMLNRSEDHAGNGSTRRAQRQFRV